MAVLLPEDLKAIPLFATLDLVQCEMLLDRCLETTHSVDQVVIYERDWGESLFLIRSGMVKVRSYTPDGDEIVVSVLGVGDVFGEMAILEGGYRSADVVALTKATIARIRSSSFESLIKAEPLFALSLARLMSQRLRDLNTRFAIQSADATTRLLNALAYLAIRSSAERSPMTPIPAMAQREIGLLAGLSRETTSRTLSKLRANGTVVDDGDSIVLNNLGPLVKRGLLPASAVPGA